MRIHRGVGVVGPVNNPKPAPGLNRKSASKTRSRLMRPDTRTKAVAAKPDKPAQASRTEPAGKKNGIALFGKISLFD